MNPDSPLVSFLIVTMNRSGFLRDCLLSIASQEYPNLEILVLDNASSDETEEMLRTEFPHISVLREPENIGVVRARNKLFRLARGDYFICLDDDVRLLDVHTSSKMVDYFRNHAELGCLSFCVVLADLYSPNRMAIPRRDKTIPPADSRCGHFAGGACALRASVVLSIGGYWEKLSPIGAEEFDLSYRLIEAGSDIVWTRSIGVYHHETPTGRLSGRRVYFETRNRPWIAFRHLPLMYCLSTTLLWWIWMLLHALRSWELSFYFKGIYDSISGISEVWRIRKRLRKATCDYLKLCSGPLWY